LFIKDTNVGVSDKDFYYAYSMSKMTVARESYDYKKYEIMNLAELLELIARIAALKYKDTMLTLVQKIELVLDELFKLIQVERKEVTGEMEVESCSDDDY